MFIEELEQIIKQRQESPDKGSYTASLFEGGMDRILKKVGEEAGEVLIAAKNSDSDEFKHEVADLLYHVMVLLAEKGISVHEVDAVLKQRHRS